MGEEAEVSPEATPVEGEVAASPAEGEAPAPGESPEWLLGKYVTEGRTQDESIAEQAKAYGELQSRFGGFTGAPDEYQLEVSEELTEQGFEIEEGDILMEEAKTFAKDLNMDQSGFNRMVEMYAKTEFAKAELEQDRIEGEKKLLGDNAQGRIDNLAGWAQANLPPEDIEGFEQAATSAAAVQALEQIIARTRNAPANPAGVQSAPGSTADDVRAMQFEKDTHGNRRIQTDREFRKRYESLRDQVYGSEPHKVVVGG